MLMTTRMFLPKLSDDDQLKDFDDHYDFGHLLKLLPVIGQGYIYVPLFHQLVIYIVSTYLTHEFV